MCSFEHEIDVLSVNFERNQNKMRKTIANNNFDKDNSE